MLMAAFEARRAARGMFEMRTDKLADLHARVAALKRRLHVHDGAVAFDADRHAVAISTSV